MAIMGSRNKNVLRLKVVIVGAGIGGMAAAVGCGLAGHDVLVLEDAPAIGEVGAGLQVAPNMMRILERWGLRDVVIKDSVSLTEVHIRRWQNGALLGVAPVNKNFGEQYVIHRADLHRSLYERATSLPNVAVRVNSTVMSADFDAPSVMLKTGETVTADVVLGADGLKSRLRQQLLELTEDLPVPTGDVAYRITLPREAMLHDPQLRELIDTPRGTRWIGPGRHIMAYPIKQHKLYNMVLLHPDTLHSDSEELWTARGTKQELIDTYAGWDPMLQKLFALIPDQTVTKWKLCSHDFLPTWVRGSVALLGDACHPMVPYVAQGAAQAVEDAATLAVLLSAIPSTSDIPQALQLYQIARKSRAETIQGTATSNRETLHLPDGPAQEARDAKFAGVLSGGENPDKWGDPTHQRFLWGWDAEKAAMEVIDTTARSSPPEIVSSLL